MLVLFVLELAITTLLYFYLKDKSNNIEEVEIKRNGVTMIILPTALYVVDRLITGRFISYERKLNSKLAVLYGVKDIKHRLRTHLAGKIMYIIMALLGLTLLGALMENLDISYCIFAAALLLAIFYIPDRELNEKVKRRNFLIQYDFPDFLNKLVLLVNAGMTVPRAWEKIVRDRKSWTPLYEELNTTYLEIRNGKPEVSAYEDFARRCRVKEITKFITTIIQNLKKGNGELVSLLKLQSNECWQLRKNMARKLGEEASTKLVLPLMIMFVGILVIVILPAILQLRYL